jgi:phytoene synthase
MQSSSSSDAPELSTSRPTPADQAPLPADAAERGLAECWAILREHGKTFHLMARLLGDVRGDAIAALYAFARVADDAVDEPPPWDTPERIREQLAWMQAELRRAVAGKTRVPTFLALGDAVRRYGIPLEPFDELVLGVEMDLDKFRYETFAELELYCYRVAGTVGLLITPVAGYRAGTAALEHAKTLGTAMQLTNILRDVGEDLDRGRIYLPLEDLARFDVTEADLLTRRNDHRFRALMEFEIQRAERLYAEGLALIPLLTSSRGRAAFQFAVEAYAAILGKIRASGYDVFSARAHLSLQEKLALVPGTAWRAWWAGVAGMVAAAGASGATRRGGSPGPAGRAGVNGASVGAAREGVDRPNGVPGRTR